MPERGQVNFGFRTGFNEQCLISEVLSESDSQIQSIENLIKKKRDIKKGTMQYLVSGKVRLPGFVDDWGQEPQHIVQNFHGIDWICVWRYNQTCIIKNQISKLHSIRSEQRF